MKLKNEVRKEEERLVESNIIKGVFQLIEEEEENISLYQYLKRSLKQSVKIKDGYFLMFLNGISISITKCLDFYNLDISNELMYDCGEDRTTKISQDRMCYYLNKICRTH
ncbi:hypothetical protein [Caudoviricetes sp.]|nr:hypothetical protein [Caudoviricetes sp.]